MRLPRRLLHQHRPPVRQRGRLAPTPRASCAVVRSSVLASGTVTQSLTPSKDSARRTCRPSCAWPRRSCRCCPCPDESADARARGLLEAVGAHQAGGAVLATVTVHRPRARVAGGVARRRRSACACRWSPCSSPSRRDRASSCPRRRGRAVELELHAGHADVVGRASRSRATVPVTVAPCAGAVSDTVGAVVSAVTVACASGAAGPRLPAGVLGGDAVVVVARGQRRCRCSSAPAAGRCGWRPRA